MRTRTPAITWPETFPATVELKYQRNGELGHLADHLYAMRCQGEALPFSYVQTMCRRWGIECESAP